MERLSQAILDKVRAEAQNIIREAEEKAREEIEKAERQREARFEEEKSRMLEEAKEEASRILALASIKERQQLSSAKAEVIAKIIDGARKELSQIPTDENHLLHLIREGMDGLGMDRARIYVSPKDLNTARKSLQTDREFSARIIEIKEFNCLGGVIIEDVEGKLRIDNTYETRLEMLLPKLLPEISKELFETA